FFFSIAILLYVSGQGSDSGIPLKDVYATFGGQGPRFLAHGLNDNVGRELEDLYRNYRSGASQIFLIRGRDIPAAVRATRQILVGGATLDSKVALGAGSVGEGLWLVVYFGQGITSPPAYRIHSVELTGNSIRVSYSMPKPKGIVLNESINYYV